MDTLRTVELYRDDKRKLIAIESVEFNHTKSKNSCQLYGALVPVAFVVCTSEGKEVLRVDTDNVQPDKLRKFQIEVDELISRACSDGTNKN